MSQKLVLDPESSTSSNDLAEQQLDKFFEYTTSAKENLVHLYLKKRPKTEIKIKVVRRKPK
jgi:hypothetical protein